jgi:GNAT superfamily N-acetyltransferase
MIDVKPLRAEDRDRWAELWEGYLTFYKTSLPAERYAITWRRMMDGDGLFGFGAYLDGRLVGITHYLFHGSTWGDDVCYLQDLFADPAVRGQGIGRTLIEAVAAAANAAGASRLYWLTQDSNATARLLYDRLAENRGFIRYDYKR